MTARLDALRRASPAELGGVYERLVLDALGVETPPWARWAHAYGALSAALTTDRGEALASAGSGEGANPDTRAVAALVHGQRTLITLVDVFRAYPPPAGGVSDMGSGSGAAALAAAICGVRGLELVDRAAEALSLAERLMRLCGASANTVVGDARTAVPAYDTIVAAFSMNELGDASAALAGRWVQRPGARIYILEPGTIAAARNVQQIRDALVARGVIIQAPCTHRHGCPLVSLPRQWCHVSRPSRLGPIARRILSDAGKDEHVSHFSWLVTGGAGDPDGGSRVLSKPPLGKGKVGLDVCDADGLRRLTALSRDAAATWFSAAESGNVVRVGIQGLRRAGDGFRVGAEAELQVVRKL